MRRVIVDTSVFVEFLRGRRVGAFELALRTNSILLSPYVRLELLQGLRKQEARRVGELLTGIPQVPHRAELFGVAEEMVAHLKGSGIKLGIVDLLIAAQARLVPCAVMSFDAAFTRLHRLGLVETVT